MPTQMREITRKRLLKKARDVHEPIAAAHIFDLLDRRRKILNRELRRSGLRKRLGRNLRQTGDMFKAEDESWDDWIDSFAQGVEDALTPFVVDDWMVETKYWNSRAFRPAEVDPAAIFDAYEARVGRQITKIGDETKQRTLQAISSWYNTDESIPELIDRLAPEFGERRAEAIARTESTNITSQVALDMYGQVGVGFYNIDLGDEVGPWPCDECRGYAEGGPYRVGVGPMPPFHPLCRCGSVAASEDGGVFFFGMDQADKFLRVYPAHPSQSHLPVLLRASTGTTGAQGGN